MDKVKVGLFLKKLRIEHNYSQEKLCDIFNEEFDLLISVNAISSWENGKSIPEMEKLNMLSSLYNVTIDEILDGERYKNVDYSKIYYISNEKWTLEYDCRTVNTYSMRQEQIIKINKKINELEMIRASRIFTKNEEEEFKFLFEHFYHLSNYYTKYTSIQNDSDYLKLTFAINKCFSCNNYSSKDIVWEFQKMIIPNDNINLRFSEFQDLEFKNNKYIIDRFKNADFWQKDMILTLFQKYDFVDLEKDSYGSNALKDYENRTRIKHNPEVIQKETLKFLINNGACINSHYLNFIRRDKVQRRVIDKLEKLYDLCLKPLDISVYFNGGTIKHYKVENNIQNRFASKYYCNLSVNLNDFDYDEMYELFINNYEFPKELITYLCGKNNINMDQEEKYIMADIKSYYSYNINKWNEYQIIEKEIEDGLKEILKFEQMLKDDQQTYLDIVDNEIGGKNLTESIEFYYNQNTLMTYDELKKCRKVKETKKLLTEIDNLSVAEIRDKYFKMEVYENE